MVLRERRGAEWLLLCGEALCSGVNGVVVNYHCRDSEVYILGAFTGITEKRDLGLQARPSLLSKL